MGKLLDSTGLARVRDWIKTNFAPTNHSHTTVNGHTVNADVPSDAVFTDHTYNIPTKTSDLTNDSLFGIPYGECSTVSGTAAKTVTVSPAITALTAGQVIAVKFSGYNGAMSPTLNVNNLGAKSIRSYGTNAPSTSAAFSWQSGQTVLFRYDGTYWVQLTPTRPVSASSSVSGFMSATHYAKLEGIEDNANNYSLPTASSSTLGGVKVGSGLSISDGVLSVSGSGLPAVTASDNGKFLQVVNGAWAAASIPYANGVSF